MKLSQINEYINSLSEYSNFDSGVIWDNGNEVKNILMALDYDESVHDIAINNGFDTLFIHHSFGKYYYTAYKGIYNKLSLIEKLGLHHDKYDQLIKNDMVTCFMQMRNTNMIRMLHSFSRPPHKLSCIVSHHVPDYLMYKEISTLVHKTKSPIHLYELLREMVKNISFIPVSESVKLFTGSSSYKVPFIDICFVSSGSDILQKKLMEDGVDMLILTTTSNEVINYAIANKKSIILLNHISYDVLGMNLLKDRIEPFVQGNIRQYEF